MGQHDDRFSHLLEKIEIIRSDEKAFQEKIIMLSGRENFQKAIEIGIAKIETSENFQKAIEIGIAKIVTSEGYEEQRKKIELLLSEVKKSNYSLVEFPTLKTTVPKNKVIDVKRVVQPYQHNLFKVTELLFSKRTQKEVFMQIIADWDEEIFEALKKDKDANLFMINVRNTYGFILAMWQKSPLGDLLEYARKIAS